MSNQSDMKKELRSLRRRGFETERTKGGNHVRITKPGHAGCVITATTPSDFRGLFNLRAAVRRTWKDAG